MQGCQIGCNVAYPRYANATSTFIPQTNDGEKWKVVENMSVYIRNMEKAVNEFKGDNYPALAKTIDENIRALTENCTMEGQAHDELHKWLLPFIELSEEFDVATEKENQEKIYQEFKKMFVEYNTYFE